MIWYLSDPILNIVARDSKAILAAFGKSPTPEHLNQHQRKNREDLEKVHLKFSSFYDLYFEGATLVCWMWQRNGEICD